METGPAGAPMMVLWALCPPHGLSRGPFPGGCACLAQGEAWREQSQAGPVLSEAIHPTPSHPLVSSTGPWMAALPTTCLSARRGRKPRAGRAGHELGKPSFPETPRVGVSVRLWQSSVTWPYWYKEAGHAVLRGYCCPTWRGVSTSISLYNWLHTQARA